MSPDPFPALPDSARLWLLALDADPDPATRNRLAQGLAAILGQWRHKGQAYTGDFALLEGRILAVAEPSLAANPSGCAIDGMLRKVTRLAGELGLGLIDPAGSILARVNGFLRAIPKTGLEAALEDGTLDPGTPVLDLALYNLGDLRAGRLESPLAGTWIGRKFSLAAPGPPPRSR